MSAVVPSAENVVTYTLEDVRILTELIGERRARSTDVADLEVAWKRRRMVPSPANAAQAIQERDDKHLTCTMCHRRYLKENPRQHITTRYHLSSLATAREYCTMKCLFRHGLPRVHSPPTAHTPMPENLIFRCDNGTVVCLVCGGRVMQISLPINNLHPPPPPPPPQQEPERVSVKSEPIY